jgi:hypothetical protein
MSVERCGLTTTLGSVVAGATLRIEWSEAPGGMYLTLTGQLFHPEAQAHSSVALYRIRMEEPDFVRPPHPSDAYYPPEFLTEGGAYVSSSGFIAAGNLVAITHTFLNPAGGATGTCYCYV